MATVAESTERATYRRKVAPIERLFTRSPFSIVTVVARILGSVSVGMLRTAVAQVRTRHPNLRVRITEDASGQPWFDSEGAGAIPVDAVPRESDDHWQSVVREACLVPFEFEVRPAVRFILVQGDSVSELVVVCHHILCDGLSLAYLARDVMVQLGTPDRAAEALPDPVPVTIESIPEPVTMNAIVRFAINRMNKKWAAEKVAFDQDDYELLCGAYWARYEHQMASIELSKEQTSRLVERCRREGVTVNSALSAAFLGAQTAVQDPRPHHASIGVAASLRDRLPRPVGEAMGFYAGLAALKFKYQPRRDFWENARRFHRKVRPLFTDENLLRDPLLWCHLDPTILEAIHFKKLGALVPRDSERGRKLSDFGSREDVVSSILKRDKQESLDRVFMGTAVTNLTRMDFPTRYGALELDRLILKPGGAFPLVNVNLVLAAVTCAGKLSLALEYVEQNITTEELGRIKAKALEFLLGG